MADIKKEDLARGRKLKLAAVTAPLALTAGPAILTLLLMLLFAGSPPTAAVMLFLGAIAITVGFVVGITTGVIFALKRSVWTKEMRETIASDGIKAEEIGWFQNELRSNEKRAL